jgi:hypothetical protein
VEDECELEDSILFASKPAAAAEKPLLDPLELSLPPEDPRGE